MDLDRIRETLEDAGFTQYEAEVYLALVRNGKLSATGIAEATDVPKSRVYDVLRTLEGRDLIELYQQDRLRGRALDPGSLVERLRGRAASFEASAGDLSELWEEPDLGEQEVTLVTRLETVVDRAKRAIRDAENEVQIAATIEQFDRLRPVLREAFARDVFVKLTITPAEYGGVPDVGDREFDGVVSEASRSDLPGPFLVIVDRSRICFTPQPGTAHNFGIVANNVPLADVFHWYFQTSLWEAWDLVYTTRNAEPPITYVDIRQCVVDVAPLLHEDATIEVTATGIDPETGDARTVSGTVVDLYYTGSSAGNHYPTLPEVSGKVTMFVDDGEEVVSIGGWYAHVEDLELRRLTVQSVSESG
ncbi:TrmB family transcriptional regulator [Saliphagus infecundisoli]|uniref:TrmB family transcriptional regulator n=1 Tax=Saliphagus infecundisoli TaxID=1849069 RepID=A0ABD5QLP7_9EURY|nr:TrmB family transcriptional regulator [Saliphagus infecundisoli]